MSKTIQTVFIFTITIIFIAGIAGCQEGASPQKAKILAAENNQLKKDIQQRDKELEKQKEQLATCQNEKAALEKSSKDTVQGLTAMMLETMGSQNKKLQEENKQLKAEIEKLKK